MADVVHVLRAQGYRHVRAPRHLVPSGPPPATFWIDRHVPALLVLPAGCELHEQQMVRSGALILQDKASCFPPVALRPSASDRVVDGCAAPGNKTSMLCASGCEVLAVERDAARAHTLRARLALAAAPASRSSRASA